MKQKYSKYLSLFQANPSNTTYKHKVNKYRHYLQQGGSFASVDAILTDWAKNDSDIKGANIVADANVIVTNEKKIVDDLVIALNRANIAASDNKRQIDQKTIELQTVHHQLEQAQTDLSQAQTELTQAQTELTQAQTELKGAREKMKDVNGYTESKNVPQNISAIVAKIEKLNTDVSDLRNQRDIIEKQLAELTAQKTKTDATFVEIVDNLVTQRTALKSQIDTLTPKQKEATQTLNQQPNANGGMSIFTEMVNDAAGN